jgi:TRAP transporter TAXI family solute receptor
MKQSQHYQNNMLRRCEQSEKSEYFSEFKVFYFTHNGRMGAPNQSHIGVYLFVLCFAFCLFQLSVAASYADSGDTLTLATGSEKGIYYALGQGIAEAARKANVKIRVLKSQGSRENLLLVANNRAQLCIAQSDTVYDAYNGLSRFTEKITNIRAIASLYTEAVHILIRNPLYIRTIEDFKGKRISIGPEGSGTESNAIAVLEAAGITPNNVQLLHLSIEDSITAINEGTVDIVFVTSGYPSTVVNDLMKNKTGYFFEPNPEILERLVDVYPFFITTRIPSGTYPNQDEDITTIGVRALLIARSDLDYQLGYRLTKAIFHYLPETANSQQGLGLDLKGALKGVPIEVSNSARQLYDEEGLYKTELYIKITTNYILPALFLVLFTIAVINFKKVKRFFATREIARVIVVLILIWIFGSIILYQAEHKINESYSSLLLAFWSALINWINFGAKEPFTYIGRITSITMTILGVGGITWLTGTLASNLVQQKLVGGKRMIEKLRNHYVIINWNDKGRGVIEQLRSPDIEKNLY